MTIKWAMAGCKSQTLTVLKKLSEFGFYPQHVFTHDIPCKDKEKLIDFCNENEIEHSFSDNLSENKVLLERLDLLVVCRFSLLSKDVFLSPKLGSINIHNSLLPSYRGVHPVTWSLIHGCEYTGVSIHSIDEGIDTGTVICQKKLAISSSHNIHTLTKDLEFLSALMLLECMASIQITGAIPSKYEYLDSDDNNDFYARRRNPSDSKVPTLNSYTFHNYIRALLPPYPCAYCLDAKGNKVSLLESFLLEEEFDIDKKNGEILEKISDAAYLVNLHPRKMLIAVSEPLDIRSVLSV